MRMLTVTDKRTGQQLIFMDFYPCKVKDFPQKLADLTAKIKAYEGAQYGRTNANKAHAL